MSKTTAVRAAGETLTQRQIVTVMVGLMLGMFLASLDQTIVSTSIYTIANDLDGLSLQAWATTAYPLTSTVTPPLYGHRSELFGPRPASRTAPVPFRPRPPLAAAGQRKRPPSRRLASSTRPGPAKHRTLRMSPRLPRKTKTWPQNGFAASAVCTMAARPSKPFLMSVWPATIHTRVFEGRPITGAAPARRARRPAVAHRPGHAGEHVRRGTRSR